MVDELKDLLTVKIEYLKKMITISWYDKVADMFLCSLTMPYDKRRGNLVKVAKQLKEGAAFHIPACDVKVKIKVSDNVVLDRCILKMASGIILDYPAGMNERDCKIILAQLDVLKMAHE